MNSDVLACVFPRLKASAASIRKCDFQSFENSLETLLKSNHVVNVCPNVELSVGSELQNEELLILADISSYEVFYIFLLRTTKRRKILTEYGCPVVLSPKKDCRAQKPEWKSCLYFTIHAS